MNWITTVNGLIALITGLMGLIGTGVGVFFAVKGFLKAFKEKDLKQKWALIMEIADAAMKEYEHSTLHGADKKKAVMDSVKASCKAAGIDCDLFIDQLDAYIEQAIKWYNEMSKKD